MKAQAVLCSVLLLITGAARAADARLDIGAYLKLGSPDKIYPTAAQLQMLRPLVPDGRFQPAPPISNRDYWQKVATTPSGKAWLKQAQADFDRKPEVPISDEVYREANLKGSRPMYKPKYYNTMERLEKFILAECMENSGRYLPRIEVYLRAIMDMKSWLHPNHDDKENSDLEGRRVSIDLGARKFGSDLALAEVLLGDRLPESLRQEMSAQLNRRIVESYLKSCRNDATNNKWIRGTNNWNAVCTSGAVFVTIATAGSADDRVAAIGCALNSMRAYLDGFGDDGYCSEGAGYWGYGFGHYLYLAQIVADYTHGAIDLFAFDHPEKLQKIADFPKNAEIQDKFFPTFSDATAGVSADGEGDSFARLMTAKYYGTAYAFSEVQEEAVGQLVFWAWEARPTRGQSSALPNHSVFDDFGMVVSRGKQTVPFSFAFKAGHNAENHNHSDVGSYVLILGKDLVAGDLGRLSYIAGAFDADNPGRSSWGHPVPLVDGRLQSNGRSFHGKITEEQFTAAMDRVVMDIRPAYELPALTSLIRTMVNNRSGTGTITVQDQFSAATPIQFGTAVTTFAKYEIVNDHTILLSSKNHQVRVEISSTGGALQIKAEPVAARLGGGPATRIGLNFAEPSTGGSIEVRYQPVGRPGEP